MPPEVKRKNEKASVLGGGVRWGGKIKMLLPDGY